MSALFEELAYSQTPMGELILRRRKNLSLNRDIYEVILNEEHLMSNLFTEGETQLAHLGLDVFGDSEVDVVIGGLGLGFTANSALQHENVKSLLVVEAIPEVIHWHENKLVPLGESLIDDIRCQLIHGDFFAMARSDGFDPKQPSRKYDAILLDIDHSPRAALHESHRDFYAREGLMNLRRFLKAGGIFALWSNDPPDDDFVQELDAVFPQVEAQLVPFHNPLQDREESDTVYLAKL